MKIAINCRSFLKSQPTGIGRYAYHLVKSLAEIDPDNEYRLYAPTGLFNFKKRLPRFPAKNVVPRFDLFGRGPESVIGDVDVYHAPSPGPWETPDGLATVVTVHDVIIKAYPKGHTDDTIQTGERQLADICRKASKIICCSRSTARDLQKYFAVVPDKLALVYQGVDKKMFYPLSGGEQAAAEKVLKAAGVERPYLLSVGTLEPRKNLVNVIRTFHRLRTPGKFTGKLVVVGMAGWLNTDVGKTIEELGLARDVLLLGYVSDRTLCYLYNLAQAFVFPSFYEGFGFPIIEAFCCGVPVVTSNVSSCPEIAGDAALTVDPNSEDAITGAIERILEDAGLRGSLIQKGRQRAEDFDFRKTAEETLKVYREVFGRV